MPHHLFWSKLTLEQTTKEPVEFGRNISLSINYKKGRKITV